MSEEERAWICHEPDPVVRPGGLPYPAGDDVTDRDGLAELPPTAGVRLAVAPLANPVPRGAPVRLHLTLKNSGSETASVPERLELHYGRIDVVVHGPGVKSRTVLKSVLCCPERLWTELAPRHGTGKWRQGWGCHQVQGRNHGRH